MADTYNYDSFRNLSPAELLFFITVDQTMQQLGIDDAEGVFLILAGLPLIPTRQKFAGATKGTSLASVLSRTLINYDFKRKILPTLTINSMKSLKILFTKRLSVFVGRAVPGVGWLILGHDVFEIIKKSLQKYDQIVLPKDRIF